MASRLQDLQEKYLSYLQPEQFFDVGLTDKPSRIYANKERKSKFDKLQSKKCNEGKQYISRSGKVTREKAMTFQSCNCPLQCWKKFSEQKLENVFKEFWEMGSVHRRREFVARFCGIAKKGMRNAFLYSLPDGDSHVKVCRQFFCDILDVTFRFISWTLCNKLSPCKTHVKADGRGRVGHKILSNEQFNDIVGTFVGEKVLPSHYGRRDSNNFYFEASKSFISFYDKYKTIDNQIPKVHYATFVRTIRATFPHLKFMRKARDKCDLCRLYETSSLQARTGLEERYIHHLVRKDAARAAKNFDMEIAKAEFQNFENGMLPERTFMCLEIDFEKTLPVPCCSQAYYSVLAVYHLTLMDIGSGEVYSFIYDETQGKKSSVEVGTCLFKFLTETVPRSVRRVHIYQDNTSSQSKNRYVICSLIHALWKSKGYLEEIEMRFLEKGHTDLILDMVHSLVERRAKKKISPIGVPDDWIALLKEIRPAKPVHIINMVFSDFIDWKTSANGKLYSDFYNAFKWKEGVRWGITRNRLCQSNSFDSDDICEDYQVDAIRMKVLSTKYSPPHAYRDRQTISLSKLESLVQYVKNAKIPRKHLLFYLNLPVDGFPLAIKELKSKLASLDTENLT